MSTINPTLPSTRFLGNGDFSWWLGTVRNADDKDAKLGRAKVCILGYHKPGEKPENLPWAMVMAPTDSAGANGVGSAANQLKPGSFVVGFFLDYPDCQQPIVIGTLLSKINPVVDKDTQEFLDYPRGYDNEIYNGEGTPTGQPSESEQSDKTSNSAVAATAEHSVSNPSGKVVHVPVADGKNGGNATASVNLNYAVNNIAKTLVSVRRVKKKNTSLSHEIDSEEQTIPVESTEGFPDVGVIKIGSEIIGYTNKSSKKLVLAKRGFDGTDPVSHEKGEDVELILKSEYIGGDEASSEGGDILGAFSDTLVDLKGVIDSNLEFIRDSVWWIVNQMKSFLLGQATQLLNAIGIAAISPIPMTGKIITNTIIDLLNNISCYLDDSIIEILMAQIEEVVYGIVDKALDIIDVAQCIFDSVFEALFSIVDFAEQIFETINSISEILGGGNFEQITDLSQLNLGSVVEFIFSLLGIGCQPDFRDPRSITFSSCDIALPTKCGPGGISFGSKLEGIKGRFNPEYSKIIGTFSETGTMIAMDDTPYNSRLIIEHGPSKSGIHIYDNGDVRITNSQSKTEVTVKDQEVVVHGNVKMVVDGDYHLKVGRDYHLEVLGYYNVAVNRESTITYAGDHQTVCKNNGRFESQNGIAIVGSKVGLSASGQYELHAPIATTFCTEQNHFSLGSFNINCTFYNLNVAANSNQLIGGISTLERVGANFVTGLGFSNISQIGYENEWWGGKHSQVGMGLWDEIKLGADTEFTTGVTAFAKQSAYLESISGAAFRNTTGLMSDSAIGLQFNSSAAVKFDTAPLVNIT